MSLVEDGEVIMLDSAFGQTVRLTSSKWNILSTMRKNTVYQHVVLSPDERGNRSEFVLSSTQSIVEKPSSECSNDWVQCGSSSNNIRSSSRHKNIKPLKKPEVPLCSLIVNIYFYIYFLAVSINIRSGVTGSLDDCATQR